MPSIVTARRELVQKQGQCCAGEHCKEDFPINTHSQCIGCLYSVNGTCCIPVTLPRDLKEGTKLIPTCFTSICFKCTEMNHLAVQDKGNVAKTSVYGGYSPARSWIDRAIQKVYPKICIEEVETKKDPVASSKEDYQGTTQHQMLK
jgi:hypothetical protein